MSFLHECITNIFGMSTYDKIISAPSEDESSLKIALSICLRNRIREHPCTVQLCPENAQQEV
jgi:hypothetical protein